MNGNVMTTVGMDFIQDFGIAVGLGLLMGLERERNPSARAGLRTFGLVGMLGTVAALLAEKTGTSWLLAAGLLMVGLMMVAAYLIHPDEKDPGTTSVVALLLCYCYGAMIWYGYQTLAVMLGISTTVLLYFKAELRKVSEKLTRKDIISILQFAVLSLVILPILPDTNMGPYDALSPRQVWWMVVLISGFSLAGYAALRFMGQQLGAPLLGIFGGLASSTATTLVFARHAVTSDSLVKLSLVVVLTANLVVLFRLGAYAAVLQPGLLQELLPILLGGLLFGSTYVLFAWRGLSSKEEIPLMEFSNPAEIRTAMTFGCIYAVVLVITAALSDYAGSSGLYIASLVSGLTDVDAIALSSMRLYGLEKLSSAETVNSITIAMLANLVFKLGIVIAVAGRRMAGPISAGFGTIALGSCVGWML
ncbi:MgtC/SapB family protein [Azovibrio restrictus]|uniref:MgtC/SapB family protein n=1 Tax=Azovibrio restrictus TaxID=146938 RepID=UPI0026EB33D4|nr:MgtC/SapB family protein [Azovibrio restrictus]